MNRLADYGVGVYGVIFGIFAHVTKDDIIMDLTIIVSSLLVIKYSLDIYFKIKNGNGKKDS